MPEIGSWQSLVNIPQCMDAVDLMGLLPDGVVNLCFADPPYNIGKAAWDKIDGYLEWCERWIAEVSRVLVPNGAFWVSHSEPDILVDISRMIAKHGRGRANWVTWDKYNDAGNLQGFMDGFTLTGDIRSFQPMAEYLIWHTDEGDWMAQCDRERGFIFEPIRAYLAGEWTRAGLHFEQANEACGTASMAARHYFAHSQWCMPTPEHYEQLRVYANSSDHGGEYLRREYEDLRYTFHNPGKVSSVWQIPPAPRTWHPTPKPEALLERIILATSNEGDVVLDPFMGSGTTARVAQRLGRQWICGDNCAEYVERARAEIAEAQAQLALPLGA